MATVNIRLEAASRAELDRAIAELTNDYGDRLALSEPRPGRKGGWLAYGSLTMPPSPDLKISLGGQKLA